MVKKTRTKLQKKLRNITLLVAVILIGTGSWILYKVVSTAVGDVLSMIGIENFYLQALIILVLIVIVLALFGVGIWKGVEKLVKR